MIKQTSLLIAFFIIFINILNAQNNDIPKIYTGVHKTESGKYFITDKEIKYYAISYEKATLFRHYHKLSNLANIPEGDENGLKFDFKEDFKGTLYYGLIDYKASIHPIPVFFKKKSKIKDGKSYINIKKRLSGIYDMSGWEKSGTGTLGYRIINKFGEMLFDGIISFSYKDGQFAPIPTITEGPFINKLTSNSVTISFKTNILVDASVGIGVGSDFYNVKNSKNKIQHEITFNNLEANKSYDYTVEYGKLSQKYTFKTAPKAGSRTNFTFAYASDSRAGSGGGERNIYGTNAYIMRKISALATYEDAVFMQFTGDMVNGYSINEDEMNLQYTNWKHVISPFAHQYPIIPAMGNHEAVGKLFATKLGKRKSFLPGFPFETKSASAIFAKNFTLPENGPVSEDGSEYDPDANTIDFPPYKETVFYYTYDNIAMIVLNSNYLYAPMLNEIENGGGNLHGYLMDNQIKWLDETIAKLEKDKTIDHIFVTQHTPTFPNSAHTDDDMWYSGNNKYRPIISGKPVKKGIIERRDEYLNILVNKSSKVRVIFTGDEHNYNKTKITKDINIYPEKYSFTKVKRKRTIWQINNGSAGAPYYAQDKNVPWTKAVSGFTTQTALVLINVNGKKITVKVVNPDTLELIEEYKIVD